MNQRVTYLFRKKQKGSVLIEMLGLRKISSLILARGILALCYLKGKNFNMYRKNIKT